MATNRDDFSEKVKRAIAMRASYRCSFDGCGMMTVGPSEESLSAVTLIGEAAHIKAAAPGGRRYDASLTPEQRSDIQNAIWLCVNHSRAIDRDEARYTSEMLHIMKQKWEAKCFLQSSDEEGDLFALGPDVVCLGTLLEVSAKHWKVRVGHFLVGDLNKIIRYIDSFRQLSKRDQFVVLNEVGDGRILNHPPTLSREGSGFTISCPVEERFPRINASSIGADFKLSEGDLTITATGDIALVSGLEALPQLIENCLSVQKGEMWFTPEFGTLIGAYYSAFRFSPWLQKLLKLEMIRLAAIPHQDVALRREYTPLQSVDTVHSLKILRDEMVNQRLLVYADLEVKGVGRQQIDLSIFVPFK